jgi:hypothetical protein
LIKWCGKGARKFLCGGCRRLQPSGGKSGAGLGETLDAAPHGASSGQIREAKPASMLRAGGQGNVSSGLLCRSLAIAAPRSVRDLWGGTRPGTKRADPRFLVRRCAGTPDSAPSRRLAGRVGFGNSGMRDCVTPNFPRPVACARWHRCSIRFHSATWVRITAAVTLG